MLEWNARHNAFQATGVFVRRQDRVGEFKAVFEREFSTYYYDKIKKKNKKLQANQYEQ